MLQTSTPKPKSSPKITPPTSTVTLQTQDSKTFSSAAPTPVPPPPVRSQLSIDSDSDMTESSGLLQEVSVLPPQKPRPLIIFIIGGPGSGKGSQAARLAHCFSFRVISLDELLRRQLLSHASPNRKWEVISQMMGHGELGPQDKTISELRCQLIGQNEARGFIVDGFPQDVHQALSFQEQIGSPDLVMQLLCSNETLRCRLQQRATQLGLLGDNNHALRRRLDKFQRDMVSISRYYRQLHLLTQVNADWDEQTVFSHLKSCVGDKLLPKDL
ncbi:adenylate kinase isoenzyme 5-like [Clinocottus analis]|uniref:adenylate kinase isoenzyme 5-like n=1 Tax=Clinocottus analis TaxID=304258 RepID=UPI0035BECDE7